MKSIPADIVEKIYEEMAEIAPEEVESLVQKMTEEQPVILTFLLAVSEEFESEEEKEQFFYMGVTIWRIMASGETTLPSVSEKLLEKTENKNLQMLEYLEEESEEDFMETSMKIMEDYNQPEALRYVVETLFEDPHDENIIKEENMGLFFLYLKTVIDCFDNAKS
jgi:hypothetical protein